MEEVIFLVSEIEVFPLKNYKCLLRPQIVMDRNLSDYQYL